MEIRNVSQTKPITVHSGTVNSWIMFEGEKDGLGGGLLFVTEFQVKGGEDMEAHAHEEEEYYYILYGRGEMTIDGETENVVPGDLIRIPSNALHSIKPKGKDYPIHAFCFAVEEKG